MGNLKKTDNISIYDHVIFISSYQYIIDMNASMKFLHSVAFCNQSSVCQQTCEIKIFDYVKDITFDVQNIFLATPYRDSDCPEGAPVGLGVSNGRRIPDGAFKASSSHVNREPAKGRLDEQSGTITQWQTDSPLK